MSCPITQNVLDCANISIHIAHEFQGRTESETRSTGYGSRWMTNNIYSCYEEIITKTTLFSIMRKQTLNQNLQVSANQSIIIKKSVGTALMGRSILICKSRQWTTTEACYLH